MSLLWPDVTTEQGRRSAARRGFWAGVVVAATTVLTPPPMGPVIAITFGLVAVGIHFKHIWAARAGAIASYAFLLSAAQRGDPGAVFGAFFQCNIMAYFFFNAWRGLRTQSTLLQKVASAFWLALTLLFIGVCYYGALVYPVPDERLKETLIRGDMALIRPLTSQPKVGDILLFSPASPTEAPHLERFDPATGQDTRSAFGVVRWIVWSTEPTNSPIEYYTKARWSRFPTQLR